VNTNCEVPVDNFALHVDWMQTLDITRFSGWPPNATIEGDVDSMAMYGGTGSAFIKEILPVAQVVNRILEEAQAIIEQRLSGLVHSHGSLLSTLGSWEP
jgi:hypothetical protein